MNGTPTLAPRELYWLNQVATCARAARRAQRSYCQSGRSHRVALVEARDAERRLDAALEALETARNGDLFEGVETVGR